MTKYKFILKNSNYYATHRGDYEKKLVDIRTESGWVKMEKCLADDKYSLNQVTTDYIIFDKEVSNERAFNSLPIGLYKYAEDRYGEPLLVPTPIRKESNYVKLNLLAPVEKDLNSFLGAKAIYDRLQIPYRRGYLLHGAPGNGKTSLIRELVKHHAADAYIIFCDKIPKDAMLMSLAATPGNKILVIEEIASNENIRINEFLTFMDGELSLDDCITIATTNNVEDLKANIANRPSRFDLVIKVNNPKFEDSVNILERYLGVSLQDNNKELFTKEQFSIAQLKEIALLTELYKITVKEAAIKVRDQSEAFHRGFEDKKSFGVI